MCARKCVCVSVCARARAYVCVCVGGDGLWDGKDLCNCLWMTLNSFSGLGLDMVRVLPFGPSFQE